MLKLRKKCSEIYFSNFLQKITVDEVEVDKMGVDQMGVNQMGVDKMGSRRSRNKPYSSICNCNKFGVFNNNIIN